MKGKNIRYLPALDQLRGIAALLIILYHGLHLFSGLLGEVSGWPHRNNVFLAALTEGHTAVALFMVLSGFIFAHGAAGARILYWPFIYNRVLRIFPLYIFLYFVAFSLFPEQYTFMGLLQGMLLQANLPGHLYINPFTIFFWTISVEFQFYLLFPFLVLFQRRYGLRYLILLVFLCLLFRTIGLILGANTRDSSYTSLLGRMDQFVCGMLLAQCYQAFKPKTPFVLVGVFATGCSLIAALAYFHHLGGFPVIAWYKILWPTVEGMLWASFIYFYLILFQERTALPLRLLARVGEISYSLYLTHLITIEIMKRNKIIVAFPDFPASVNALLTTILIALPATILLSSLTFYLIERPFLELRRVYLDRGPDSNAVEPSEPQRGSAS